LTQLGHFLIIDTLRIVVLIICNLRLRNLRCAVVVHPHAVTG
jgi:hypothetical protein